MIVVLGATGNVGTNVINELKAHKTSILAVTHDQSKVIELEAAGVEVAVVDVCDSRRVNELFKRARRAFLLVPPAPPTSDTNAEELKAAGSISKALEGVRLEKVVVASTYGAQQGDGVGDLSVLYDFERLVQAAGFATAINRGAYYYTNLDMLIEPAREGKLPAPFPADMILPMVSPIDLGRAAAARLLSPVEDIGVVHVEGPSRHTFAEVAAYFGKALAKVVTVETTPRDEIEESFRRLGFSRRAAASYARMTKATMDGPDLPSNPLRGSICLDDHIARLVASADEPAQKAGT